MVGIKEELRNIEWTLKQAPDNSKEGDPLDLSSIQRVIRSYEGKDEGFSASGYFSVNRALVPPVLGSLVTYLIVLLQFRAGERIYPRGARI